MEKLKISQLRFPEGLNIGLLASVLPEEKLELLIIRNKMKDRKQRRIILPSAQTIKKIVFHHLYSQILEGKISWEEIKAEFRKEYESLKALNISKAEAERLYRQREKEILREQGNGK